MKFTQYLQEGSDNPTKEAIKYAVDGLEKELEIALTKGKKIGGDALNSILGKFKERLGGAVLEDAKSEKEAQAMYDKGNKDINKDWDPPSKKQLPLQKESLQVNSLHIEINFTDSKMAEIDDALAAINDAFKRYKAGSGGAKYVNIYDEDNDKVGFLEVK